MALGREEWIALVEEIGKQCPDQYEKLMGLLTRYRIRSAGCRSRSCISSSD